RPGNVRGRLEPQLDSHAAGPLRFHQQRVDRSLRLLAVGFGRTDRPRNGHRYVVDVVVAQLVELLPPVDSGAEVLRREPHPDRKELPTPAVAEHPPAVRMEADEAGLLRGLDTDE